MAAKFGNADDTEHKTTGNIMIFPITSTILSLVVLIALFFANLNNDLAVFMAKNFLWLAFAIVLMPTAHWISYLNAR